MAKLPAPGGLDDRANVGVPGRPAQLLDDLLGAGDERGRVAGSASDDFVPDGPADDLLAGAEDFEHGDAGPGAEIVSLAHAWLKGLDGQLVGLGEVLGVDVVAHAGPVARVPVVAVDQYLLAASDGHLEDQRDQV